jgi:hypothetical protein
LGWHAELVGHYLPTVKELTREQHLLNDPGWQAERPVLLSFVEELRAACGDADLFRFQARLLERMKSRQDFFMANAPSAMSSEPSLAG